MITVYRYFAAIYGSRRIPEYIVQCRSIVAHMGAVPRLQTPLLAQVSDHLDALDLAEQATRKGTTVETADRNVKLLVVRCEMLQLKAFVQAVADTDLLSAQTLIESSGMRVVRKVAYAKPLLAARYGKVPSVVVLHARAFRGKGSYHWQMSADGSTWVDLDGTVRAKTTVTGLTRATIAYFRFRTLTRVGLSDWSMVASIVVH